jgi:hypothetical protein
MFHPTKRERQLAIAAGCAAVVLIFGVFVIVPVRDRIVTLERIIPEKQQELRQLRTISAEYVAACRGRDELREKMAAQGPDFQLLPYLESLIEQQNLARHIITMQQDVLEIGLDYAETVVTIELEDTSSRQLVDFLTAVKTSHVVAHVGNLHIHRDPSDPIFLDVTVKIHTPQVDSRTVAAMTTTTP